MIRISGIKFNSPADIAKLTNETARRLKIRALDIIDIEIEKLSVDARNKPELLYVYTVAVSVGNEGAVLKKIRDRNIVSFSKEYYSYPKLNPGNSDLKVVVIGAGPAGLFCAYALSENGFNPILLERGKDVDSRTADVEEFFETGLLKPDSNVQFGEGGAGAFSDGKLNTQVKDKYLRKQKVTDIFLEAGAPEEIRYLYHPHIGTDRLNGVIKNIRKRILENGGTVRFETRVDDIKIENNHVRGVYTASGEFISADIVVLAIGHSARDTFMMLNRNKIPMQPKPMACGVRIEHPSAMINLSQYGREDITSDYKLTCNLPDGRGVYSFCMCPGGYVINSSSEENETCVNGMSYYDRDGRNSNSALVVTVNEEDYGIHPEYPSELCGMAFQRELEKRAYEEGKGKIPVQLLQDFINNKASDSYGEFEPCHKGKDCLANLRNVLPEFISASIIAAIPDFGKRIHGFDRKDAILSGVESRTSSPVRIMRNEKNVSSIGGLYPCGEGAGYAGGIMSAAMDGLKVAEAIISLDNSADISKD